MFKDSVAFACLPPLPPVFEYRAITKGTINIEHKIKCKSDKSSTFRKHDTLWSLGSCSHRALMAERQTHKHQPILPNSGLAPPSGCTDVEMQLSGDRAGISKCKLK